LNWFLGAAAEKDGRKAKYPKVDFCKDPEVICASSEHKELKWIAGEFYWMESVQSYNQGGWDYTTELRKFVEGGMTGTSFIDSVSGIVNRGCHNPPCGTGPVDGGWERAQNFRKVLDAFFDGSPPQVVSSTIVSSTSGASGRWYPDYNSNYSLGKCVNEVPPPNGRQSYDTGVDCCNMAYTNQASGICLSSAPRPSLSSSDKASTSLPGNSLADSYFSSFRTHARKRNNFITYNCGSNVDIPMDSLIVDILFDYEISVPLTAQPQHLLPNLKKQIMDDLATTLGCQMSLRRNLRRASKYDGLLGFHSIMGGDVIDGKKGSCSESAETNEACVPVIGHLAAFVERNATADIVIATKDIILKSIQDDMGHSNLTQRIVYVSEHGNEPQHHSNNSGLDGDSIEFSSTTSTYVIIILFPASMLGVMAVLLLKRKEETNQDAEESSANFVVNTTPTSCCDQGLASKSASGGDNSCDGSISCDNSSTSSNIEPLENEVSTLHLDKGIQPITPSYQELDGTIEPTGNVAYLTGRLTNECASDSDNSSDVHSELTLHSDGDTQSDGFSALEKKIVIKEAGSTLDQDSRDGIGFQQQQKPGTALDENNSGSVSSSSDSPLPSVC